MAARVTVVGAGLAGLSATLALARAGASVTLVSPYPSERAQSVLAEGGINAVLDVMGEHDTLAEHERDTLVGGAWLADVDAVSGLVATAPAIIAELSALGVPFNAEGGHIVQRNFGGQRKKRTAFAQSSTGKALVSAMVDAVRAFEATGAVTRMAHHALAAMSVDAGGACAGVIVRDVHTGAAYGLPAPVILATGGYAGLFGGVTTGTTTNTGDATALALASGAELANLEFVQYHPTTVAISGKRLLLSEAARGEGGRLVATRDGRPWYFMEELHPGAGNLATRDVVSREVAAVLADPRCTGGVRLDLTGLPRSTWRNRLADLRDECVHYLGIDPARTPVPVEPGIHYCMGGLRVDRAHRTSVRGLYAAGECACAYHGANRLGGNSLLGALYGGRVAAAAALAGLADRGEPGFVGANVADAADGASVEGAPGVSARAAGVAVSSVIAPAAEGARGAAMRDASADERVHGFGAEPRLVDGPTVDVATDVACNHAMQRVLVASLGIRRTGEGLEAAEHELAALATKGGISERQRNRLLLARAIVACARARRESRGAHWRDDYPERDDRYRATTVARIVDGAIEVRFCPVGSAASAGGESAASVVVASKRG